MKKKKKYKSAAWHWTPATTLTVQHTTSHYLPLKALIAHPSLTGSQHSGNTLYGRAAVRTDDIQAVYSLSASAFFKNTFLTDIREKKPRFIYLYVYSLDLQSMILEPEGIYIVADTSLHMCTSQAFTLFTFSAPHFHMFLIGPEGGKKESMVMVGVSDGRGLFRACLGLMSASALIEDK